MGAQFVIGLLYHDGAGQGAVPQDPVAAARWLGAAAEAGHRQVGEHAAACADLVLVVGERARPLFEAALKTGAAEARFFNAPSDAVPVLRDELRPEDHLLVKASRAVALEAVVEALVAP